MRLETDPKIDFKDVLIRPKRSTLSTRADVDISRRFQLRNAGGDWAGVPIFASNMDSIGTIAMARVLATHHCSTVLHKFHDLGTITTLLSAQADEPLWPFVWVSIGSAARDLEQFEALVAQLADQIGPAAAGTRVQLCLDVANGYQESFVDTVKTLRERHRAMPIMAGNVVTGEMVEELLLSGADIIKVGIGGGSVCTTRTMTGVGYPQLSAVIECADAAHGLGGHIISDGGCTTPGDIAKALGAGADGVMLGGMLAGHDECEGEVIDDPGLFDPQDPSWAQALGAMSDAQRARLQTLIPTGRRMMFYGMSSDTAMRRYHGGVASYRASEGKTVTVPYRGPVEPTVLEILGGLRSACTYVGARRLKELSKRTTFVLSSIQTNDVFGPPRA